MTAITDYAYSLINQRVTVDTNPYGGQCVAFVDHLAQHFADKNLAYTNAIDLLEKAQSDGFKVTRFTGSEIPKVGDIWVTATSNHPFGHTGIFTKVDETGSYFTTLEQNVDLNADALENGGWVREKQRTLYNDGTFTYDNDPDGLLPQTMIGWFTFYEEQPKQKAKIQEGDNVMFTISAEGRGIALIQGGTFFPILDAKDPIAFWNAGAKHIQVSTKTFDAFQGKKQASTLDDATVNKLIDGLRR